MNHDLPSIMSKEGFSIPKSMLMLIVSLKVTSNGHRSAWHKVLNGNAYLYLRPV